MVTAMERGRGNPGIGFAFRRRRSMTRRRQRGPWRNWLQPLGRKRRKSSKPTLRDKSLERMWRKKSIGKQPPCLKAETLLWN